MRASPLAERSEEFSPIVCFASVRMERPNCIDAGVLFFRWSVFVSEWPVRALGAKGNLFSFDCGELSGFSGGIVPVWPVRALGAKGNLVSFDCCEISGY